jgi:hypothetical protein
MQTSPPTLRRVALGAAIITAASLLVEVGPGQDVTFLAFMLLGPPATGAALEARNRDWRIGAGAWSLAALVWLVADWAINHEDVAFHAANAVIFVALVALGAGAVRAARAIAARYRTA